MAVVVRGASDDLIEVDGDIREEFNARLDNGDGELLAFSDGTVLRIAYGDMWRITPVARGTARLSVVQALEDDEDECTDRATLDGDVRWVVLGSAIAHAPKMAG